MYTLIFGKKFEEEFRKIDNSLRQEAWKKLQRLKENPQIGKHLHYLDLWELHVRMFRIFYIIDENRIRLLILSMKHKDECDSYIRSISKEDIKKFLN